MERKEKKKVRGKAVFKGEGKKSKKRRLAEKKIVGGVNAHIRYHSSGYCQDGPAGPFPGRVPSWAACSCSSFWWCRNDKGERQRAQTSKKTRLKTLTRTRKREVEEVSSQEEQDEDEEGNHTTQEQLPIGEDEGREWA